MHFFWRIQTDCKPSFSKSFFAFVGSGTHWTITAGSDLLLSNEGRKPISRNYFCGFSKIMALKESTTARSEYYQLRCYDLERTILVWCIVGGVHVSCTNPDNIPGQYCPIHVIRALIVLASGCRNLGELLCCHPEPSQILVAWPIWSKVSQYSF